MSYHFKQNVLKDVIRSEKGDEILPVLIWLTFSEESDRECSCLESAQQELWHLLQHLSLCKPLHKGS